MSNTKEKKIENLDINKILQLLPHRYPFALVDRVLSISSDEIETIKNVTINEPFFQGHFPGNPVMPGVLQVEAMVQSGGLLALHTLEDPHGYWTYFLGIDNCKFRKMVIPGDVLNIKCKIEGPIKRGIAKIDGKAYVNDNLVSQAIMTAMITKK